MGRPEGDRDRIDAMTELGLGLGDADRNEDALTVQEAELSLKRRLGASEEHVLVAQGNLALTYSSLGRHEEAMRLQREVYFGRSRRYGEQHSETLRTAYNYANSLIYLERFAEANSLMRKNMPVARRVLGDSNQLTLQIRLIYANTLHDGPAATLDDVREAMTTIEDTERIARRVLGSAHPDVVQIEKSLRDARAALRACETQPLS